MKEIRYILILVIGSTSFLLGMGLLAPHLRPPFPPSNWSSVIPSIEGSGSMNLTTSTFNITGEKWKVYWYAPPPYPTQCVVEVYNASTDEKLQELTFFSSGYTETFDSKELNIIGSFYLKIQVSGNTSSWRVRVREYKPPPGFPTWIAWIAAIGIASLVVFFGYKKLRRK